MKKSTILILMVTIVLFAFSINWAISDAKLTERERRALVNTRIDNMGYWMDLAEKGLVPYNADIKSPNGIYKGTNITASTVRSEDSPDVPVTETSSSQSENSVIIDPNNNSVVLNSNNSSNWPVSNIFGADYFYSFDSGETYEGEITGAGGDNQGDPAACIGTDGRWYIGFIYRGGQGVSYSDDDGENWTRVVVADNPGDLADKNHLWLDRKEGSPYENYLYDAWTDFGGSYNKEVVMSRSIDKGETWEEKQPISKNLSGDFHQGVNISTGPNGEVYACWITYKTWPGDESSIGFVKSLDGGATWEDATVAIDNIRGIRSSGVPQGNRANSFPSMAVDISDGPNSGNIYIVWTNIGVPGTNTGGNRDIYIIKSTDKGANWSTPVRVNQDDDPEDDYVQFFPWIASDPSSGLLSVIFYDNRESGNQTEAWVANSSNAGESWEDFRVSDVSFPLGPIPGFSGNYAGDYLGISAINGMVYPSWGDNRNGLFLTYISPFKTVNLIAPSNLEADVDQETGECHLKWDHEVTQGFEYYIIYRNGDSLTSVDVIKYTDQLTDYGYYIYEVTAYYGGGIESMPSTAETQYGSAGMLVDPDTYSANLYVGDSNIQMMYVKNVGQLDLDFERSPFFKNNNNVSYPSASGGGDEYIFNVSLANLDHTSGMDKYADFTNYYADLKPGKSYPISVTAGNSYFGDQCAVWIDWNNNGSFEESTMLLTPDETHSMFKGVIDVPKNAFQGTTQMRVRLAGPGEKMASTGDSEYGEVEEYAVRIASWLILDPESGMVMPGDSLPIKIKFDASLLPVGTYEETVRFLTNDINSKIYRVYFTLNTTDLQVSATADPDTICFGEATQLMAMPTGGSGTYLYSWTSNPPGFESVEQNPEVQPAENTMYYLQVDDGVLPMYDTVTVVVNELPEVNLGDDQLLCGVEEYELDAGNPGLIYLWSTGETTQTILASGNGNTSFWVNVTSPALCVASDTVELNFAVLPVVDLGADTTICSSEIMLDAGNPGSTYLWSTGETTQTVLASGSGNTSFWVNVTSPALCAASDTVELNFLAQPAVDLGADTSICNNSEIMLDAGNPGSTYLWSTGETTQTIVVNAADYEFGEQDFVCEVTNTEGCSAADEKVVEIKDCTGIDEIGAAIGLEVFPNPNTGVFQLKLNSQNKEKVRVRIMNISGVLVYESDEMTIQGSHTHQVSLDGLADGIYSVFVIGEGMLINKKVVVRR